MRLRGLRWAEAHKQELRLRANFLASRHATDVHRIVTRRRIPPWVVQVAHSRLPDLPALVNYPERRQLSLDSRPSTSLARMIPRPFGLPLAEAVTLLSLKPLALSS